MKEKTRNIAVGLTVLVALMLLGGLILLFTGLPWFLQTGYDVKIASDTTHDAHPGDGIHLAGMQIGRVTDVSFTDPSHPYQGVTITARIDADIRLPSNVRAEFYTKGLVGSAYIELRPSGPARLDAATGKPLEFFPVDGSIVMGSQHFGESMVPRELTEAMKSLKDLADSLNELIAPTPEPTPASALAPAEPGAKPPTQPGEPIEPAGLQKTIGKLNRALDAMSAVLGDAENQANLKVSLANLAEATAAATETMGELRTFAEQARTTAKDFSKLAAKSQQRLDDLTEKVMGSAENVSRLMATINRLATRIEAGEGTAGKLLSDPELYKSFLEATRGMNKLMIELRQLVEAWRKDGMDVKLK